MNKLETLGFPFLLVLCLLVSFPFQSCEPDDDDNEEYAEVDKPNIYIYTQEQIQLTVNLDFPLGGEIVTSIPDYGTGWNISVDTNGLIDNTYSFLFYESIQPDIWQINNGWIIEKSELESFFTANLSDYGFYGQEINDFIDYWIPKLDNYKYYSICPQTSVLINNVIELSFSKQPDNILRLFYVIKGYDKLPNKLIEPSITTFDREGYFVTEWGVIIK